MKKSRLIIALITSLLDEAVIVFIIVWVFPKVGINLPIYVTILICFVFAIYAVVIFRTGSKALFKNPLKGFTDLVGLSGKVVSKLNKESGTILINGELWEARSEEDIEIGSKVTVVSQLGFILQVRKTNP